jgi:hypothetical protein
MERVRNVKFMWGVFACNELLFKRFGMGESEKCDVCNGIESPWYVIGEYPGKRAVEIRTDWADRMYVEARAGGDYGPESAAGIGRSECVEADVESGRRRHSPNVATRYRWQYTWQW